MKWALVLVCLAATPVIAETPLPPKKKRPDPPPPPSPPDPIVVDAANANLESTSRHQGMNVTVALGGGFTVGFGINDSVGRGVTGTLRLAQVANEHLAVTAELVSVTLLHQVKGTDMSSNLKRDQDTNLLFGAQLYANRTLWLRLAAGLGVFAPADSGRVLRGPAGLIGGGVDVVRTHRLAVAFEYLSIGMINRDGLLTSNAFLIALNVE